MMGVYGMLAIGLALFCLRYMVPEARWSDRAARISFWSLNIGLAWMRLPGDTLFILGGTVPIVYLAWCGVSRMTPRSTLEEPRDVLFTEIVESNPSRP